MTLGPTARLLQGCDSIEARSASNCDARVCRTHPPMRPSWNTEPSSWLIVTNALSNGLKSTAGGGTVLRPGVVVTGNNPRGPLVIEELVEGAVTKEIARVADGNAWLDGDAGDPVVAASPYNLSRLPTS